MLPSLLWYIQYDIKYQNLNEALTHFHRHSWNHDQRMSYDRGYSTGSHHKYGCNGYVFQTMVPSYI